MLLEHYKRIEEGANDVYHLHNLATWIEKNVYLEGKLMDMSGPYYFQSDIVNDTSRVTNIVKCAQIGLTVSTMAYMLAAIATQKQFNCIYALPTASDSQKLTVTKLNPMINGSPRLRNLLDGEVNTVELKQFGHNFLFTRGSKSETAALSISADALVADEIDRCDAETLKQFRSRLQASDLGIVKQFSTPTISGVGISREAEASKRYKSMVKCACCNYSWIPNYETDLKIPGYDGDLTNLDKHNLIHVRWQEAYWACPKCGRDPKMTRHSVTWVCENPGQNYEANTYYVNPITCCEVLEPSYLVRTSTEYEKRSEWKNQVMGEVADDTNEQITEEDVANALIQADLDSSEMHFLGADMGLVCHIAIGRMTQVGELLVVHREAVTVEKFLDRRAELMKKYRCAVSVHDAFPYTPLVMSITDYDPNAYGCSFPSTKSIELFTIVEKEEDKEVGKLNLRLVKANRTRVLDEVMGLFKTRKLIANKKDDSFSHHVMSMKRKQVFVDDELQYTWEKGDGVDHYMFALVYLYIACKLRGTINPTRDGGASLVSKFRVKQLGFSKS